MTDDLYRELFAKRPEVIKPGLARMEKALNHLGRQNLLTFPVVLVGGTNGKGSVSSFLWQLLSAKKLRVGLFTSPHLVHFEERLFSHQGMISQNDLISLWKDLKERLGPIYDELSFFEVNTLLALQHFHNLKVDYGILEVGLGGRFDATNVTDPMLSIITSIGLDHQQFLGPTTLHIASEKAGIIRPRKPLLLGSSAGIDSEALEILRKKAFELEAPCYEVDKEFIAGEDILEAVNLRKSWALPPQIKNAPQFLKRNFALSVLAAHILGELDLEKPIQLAAVTPPALGARFQVIDSVAGRPSGARLILDVCHNTHGAQALKESLSQLGGSKPQVLVSILADKDVNGILDVLRSSVTVIGLFAVPSERTWSLKDLGDRHRDLPFYSNFDEAWAKVKSQPGDLMITGSVYAVGYVAHRLGIINKLYSTGYKGV